MAKHVPIGLQIRGRGPDGTARSIIQAKSAVVNGVPRSFTNTKGDGIDAATRRASSASIGFDAPGRPEQMLKTSERACSIPMSS